MSAWQTHSWRSTTNDDCSIHSFCTTRKLLFLTLRLRMINIPLCEQRNFGENDTQRKVGTLGNTFLIKKKLIVLGPPVGPWQTWETSGIRQKFYQKKRRKLYEGFVVIFPTTTTLVTNPILGNKNNIDSMQNKKNRRLITIVSVYVNNFRYAVCKLRKEIKIVRFVLSLYHRRAREMRKKQQAVFKGKSAPQDICKIA